MELFGNSTCFLSTAPPEAVAREKEKARALRKTQWWQRQLAKGVCFYCRKPTPAKELTMDHIVPLIRFGRSTRGNVAPACKTCNNQKKYMLPIEWDDYLRRLAGEAPCEETLTPDKSKENQYGTV